MRPVNRIDPLRGLSCLAWRLADWRDQRSFNRRFRVQRRPGYDELLRPGFLGVMIVAAIVLVGV